MAGAGDAAAERTSTSRWNRALWTAFAVVLALQVWPLRELGNAIDPYVGPLPLTIAWHLGGVSALIAIYLLWMTKVWLPEAAQAEDAAGREGGR